MAHEERTRTEYTRCIDTRSKKGGRTDLRAIRIIQPIRYNLFEDLQTQFGYCDTPSDALLGRTSPHTCC